MDRAKNSTSTRTAGTKKPRQKPPQSATNTGNAPAVNYPPRASDKTTIKATTRSKKPAEMNHPATEEPPATGKTAAVNSSETGGKKSAMSTENKKIDNGKKVDPQPATKTNSNTRPAKQDLATGRKHPATKKGSFSPSVPPKHVKDTSANSAVNGSSQDVSTPKVCDNL